MSSQNSNRTDEAQGPASAQQAEGKVGAPLEQQPRARSAQTSQLLQLFTGGQPVDAPKATDAAATSTGSPSSAPRDSKKSAAQQTPAASQPQHTHDAVRLVLAAVENCKPLVAVQQVKHGTKVVHIPTIIQEPQQRSIAIRWILEAARKRQLAAPLGKRPKMAECLATELMLAAQKQGSARAKRDEMHRYVQGQQHQPKPGSAVFLNVVDRVLVVAILLQDCIREQSKRGLPSMNSYGMRVSHHLQLCHACHVDYPVAWASSLHQCLV
jgi:small subunit ribosomal protein S7